MARSQTLQADGELDVAGANNVLDLKVGKLCVEAELLDNASIFARRQLRVVFRLGASNDHLARGKDESRSLGLTNAHDDGGETLNHTSSAKVMNVRSTSLHLWVVLGITGMQSNRLQIEPAVKVDCSDNVPLEARSGHDQMSWGKRRLTAKSARYHSRPARRQVWQQG